MSGFADVSYGSWPCGNAEGHKTNRTVVLTDARNTVVFLENCKSTRLQGI
jgi:hypothetical protein